MAEQSRDPATYQTHYLTNRAFGETSEVYAELVREHASVTRYRIAVLVTAVVINLLMSIAVLAYSISSRPLPLQNSTPARCKLEMTTEHSEDWLACGRYENGNKEQRRVQYCAVINDVFCHSTSQVCFLSSFTSYCYCHFYCPFQA